MLKLILGLFSLISVFGVYAGNLLPGDSDVETEYRSMTYGTWGHHLPGVFSNLCFRYDSQTAYSGRHSIRVIRNCMLSTLETGVLPAGIYTFSVMAKSGSGEASAFIGASPFYRPSFRELLNNRRDIQLTGEWKRYEYTFRADGKNNYVMTYGLKKAGQSAFFDLFWLNQGKTAEKTGPVPAVGIALPETEGYVFLLGEKIPVTVRATTGKNIKAEICDYKGRIIFTKSGPSPLCFSVPDQKKGWYGISAQSGGARDFQSVVIVAEPVKTDQRIMPFAGLCGAQQLPEAARRIGVRWIEGHVNWFYAEEKKGVYDFEYLLDYAKIKKLRDQGFFVKTIFSLCAPEWRQSEEHKKAARQYNLSLMRFLIPEEAEPDFRRFVQEFLKKYGNDFDVIEGGGELDASLGLNTFYKKKYSGDIIAGFAGGPLVERCARIVDIINEEVRKIRPDVRIAAVRPSDVDARHAYAFTESVVKRCKSRPGLNAMGVDCYPQPRWIGPNQPNAGLESGLGKNYRAMAAVMEKYAPGSELFVSEYGYFIDREHSFEPRYQEIQANRLARSFLYGRAAGFKSFFYYYANYPDNLMEANRFTMHLWRLGNPSIAVAAYSTAAAVVEKVSRVHFTDLSNKLTVITFGYPDGSGTTAMWSTDPDYMPKISFENHQFKFTDMLGNPLDSQNLTLNENPVYVSGADFTRLKNAAENIRIQEDIPAEIFFRPASHDRLKCYVVNHSKKDMQTGYFKWKMKNREGRTDTFVVLGNSRSIVSLPMPPSRETLSMELHFDGGYQPYVCKYTAPDIHLIGEKKQASFSIHAKDHILPLDHTVWQGPEDLSMNVVMSCTADVLNFRAVVRDDMHFNRFREKNIWRGDCIQIGIDPRCNFIADAEKHAVGKDDYIMTLALDADHRPSFQIHEKPDYSCVGKLARYSVTRNEQTKETVYSLSIPLKAIDPILTRGRIFGFSCLAMEDDSGGGADHWMYLTPGIAGERRPDLFALFQLE